MTAQAAPKAKIQIVTPQVTNGKLGLGPVEHEFDVPFNPKEYSITKSAGWKDEPSKSATQSSVPEFTGPQARQMTVELFLDESEKPGKGAPTPRPNLLTQLKWLFACCDVSEAAKAQNKPSAPLLVFSWGALTFVGGVKSMNAKYTLFNDAGNPIRATASLTLQEIPTDPPPKQNPTSGAREAFTSRPVLAGDTLASIAFAEYRNPTMWRALAEANGIDDPLRLREGAQILVPAIEVAAGAK